MLSGRHIILLGILACAGLVSVHTGQQQIDHCYVLGSLEKELREVDADIQLNKIKHRALQSPKTMVEKASALHLSIRPSSDADLPNAACPQPTTAPAAPAVPALPHAPRTLGPAQIPHVPSVSPSVSDGMKVSSNP